MSDVDEQPRVWVEEGHTGGAFRLTEPIVLDGTIELGPWTATFRKGLHTFVVETAEAIQTEHPEEEEVLSHAEKCLDLLAAHGSGAYRIGNPWDRSVYWWPDGEGSCLLIRGVPEISFELGMHIAYQDRPSEIAGDSEEDPRWTEGFRFFRMAQSAPDAYSAFRYTFLAVENLLADIVPRKTENGREREIDWLERALEEFNDMRPEVENQPWLEHLDLQDFVTEVYRQVRHPVFHAKQGEEYLLPLHGDSDAKVREALVPLTRLFLELAAEYLKWPLNERPQLEADMRDQGRWVAPTEVWPFYDIQEDSEEKVKRTIIQAGDDSVETENVDGILTVDLPGWSLEDAPWIDGWAAVTGGNLITTERLGVRIESEALSSLELQVKPGVDFQAMIQTSFD